MRPPSAGEGDHGPALRPEATVSEAIEAVARSGDPVARVMKDGRLVGVVDHACLLDVVAGTGAQAVTV